MQPKEIYIADDDQNIRLAIRTFLESEGYNVKDFADGISLLEAFQEHCPDLIVLDIIMPGMDGFEVCKKIRETSIVPIIMLTARDTDMDYAMGMNLGSDDYFTKPFSVVALSMRVKAIFRRIEYEQKRHAPAEHALSLGKLTIYAQEHLVREGDKEIPLTPNEYDLLKYLAEREGKAVSREELLENIWGYQTEVETRATDDTVRRLRKKLEGVAVCIETVWGYGFRIRAVEDKDRNGKK